MKEYNIGDGSKLEAAELLEVFQWSGDDISSDQKIEKVREEAISMTNCKIVR